MNGFEAAKQYKSSTELHTVIEIKEIERLRKQAEEYKQTIATLTIGCLIATGAAIVFFVGMLVG